MAKKKAKSTEQEVVVVKNTNSGRKTVKALKNSKCVYETMHLRIVKGETYEVPADMADWLIETERCE